MLKKVLHENGLSIVFLLLTLLFCCAQIWTGWHVHNAELLETNKEPMNLPQYIVSSHCIEATFENWESEFLQMGLFVSFTTFLFQKGSSESKNLYVKEDVDAEPIVHKDAPWPVKSGGLILNIYKHSLSIAFYTLFVISFLFHSYGTWQHMVTVDQKRIRYIEVFNTYQFWFESFQNWQSEFLSVAAIVILSIFLRQIGSPESKPVDAAYSDTGR